jgi:epoxyqueuosine reductase
VAIALGNWGDPAAVPALIRALRDHEPLVRGHAAWALGQIRGDAGLASLRQAQRDESKDWVREELALALEPG